ncbi:TPM domain-containing protein [Massilia luteola]|uniref:TPM domain-containing protein n=1 Tax=Massilia luteola TaxID=3081751 RepID=UPI002ACC09A5|nr:TPM domain-containing protein [Massilia sp. Gc5]
MNALPRLLWAWMLTLLLACNACAQGQFKPVPPLRARVTDEIGMLTPDQRQKLESVLADYETKTGSQIAVLLVASTEPEAIEQYGIRVADAWKLGRKGVDDGVLLLVAKDNPKALRRLRIEAGRGVQGVLTDAQSKRILEDTIAPHFRQQDWYGGLVAGVGAIATLLNQEKFPAPQAQTQAQAQQQEDDGPNVVVSLFLILVGGVVLRAVFRPRRTRLAQPGRYGAGWGSGTTGFILGNILANAAHQHDDDRWRGGGGFSGGFSDGGGGGFSGGGGGSFDGGGASGDW